MLTYNLEWWEVSKEMTNAKSFIVLIVAHLDVPRNLGANTVYSDKEYRLTRTALIVMIHVLVSR